MSDPRIFNTRQLNNRPRFAIFKPAFACVTLLFAAIASGHSAERDRPGTPNNELARTCGNRLLEPPAVCVEFYNTATEEVSFDIEVTVDGTKVASTALPNVTCPNLAVNPPMTEREATCRKNAACVKNLPPRPPTRYSHFCTASSNFQGFQSSIEGRTGRDNTYGDDCRLTIRGEVCIISGVVLPQGIKLGDVLPNTEYCFRFKARRVSDDVVSAAWSNWTCTTSLAPPRKPRVPDVTVNFVPGGKDWRTKPPTVEVSWPAIAEAGRYELYAKRGNDRDAQYQHVEYVPARTGVHKRVYELSEEDSRDVFDPGLFYKVCAQNISGETCGEDTTRDLGFVEAPPSDVQVTKPPPEPMIKPAPRAGTILTQPEVVASDFTGTWAVSSDKSWGYQMEFTQNGNSVTGSYVVDVNGVAGRIKGTVKGKVLNFNWDQDGGYTGDGILRLSADGASFDGSYRVDDNGTLTADLLQGKWHGTLASGGALETPDEGSVDYGGCAGCATDAPDTLH